jgi:hypothetical protein
MSTAFTDQATPARPRARTSTARPAGRPASATARPGSRRLSRRAHKAVLSAHVLSSVGWFGVALTVLFCTIAGTTTDDAALAPAFTEVARATLWLSVPLGLVSAATGITLSLTTKWGLVRYWWLVAKDVIAPLMIVTDVLVVAPLLTKAIEDGAANEDPAPLIAHVVFLGLATVLSVLKPRAKTPRGRRAMGTAEA